MARKGELNVNIVKKASCPWTKTMIEKVIYQTASAEKKIRGEIEVNIIGEKEMKILNYQYRGFRKVTDVLAFAWQEDKIVQSEFLGEIFICYRQIIKQAKEFGVDTREEFSRVLAHGLLHLVGYDHQTAKEEKKMFALQEKIVKKVSCN